MTLMTLLSVLLAPAFGVALASITLRGLVVPRLPRSRARMPVQGTYR